MYKAGNSNILFKLINSLKIINIFPRFELFSIELKK